MEFCTQSAAETRGLGEALGRTARAGDVLWLHGELGVGKTELTKGVAAGLESRTPVSSPSFALIHEYQGGRLPLFHIDLYRLDANAALELGLEDYLEGDGVAVLEWGERLPTGFFPDGLDIDLADVDFSDVRRIVLRPRGSAGADWLARAMDNMRDSGFTI